MSHCQNYETSNQIDELEHENRLIRARNERLEKTLEAITARLEQAGALEVEYNRLVLQCQKLHRTLDAIVPRLEAACGAKAMPPLLIQSFIDEMLK
jgi:predicted nuclease with TOPRIM domain